MRNNRSIPRQPTVGASNGDDVVAAHASEVLVRVAIRAFDDVHRPRTVGRQNKFLNRLSEIIESPDPRDVARRRCEGADGQPIDPQLMLQPAITGRIRSVLLNADDQPIRIGPKQRFFDRNTREVIKSFDITCNWPGCEMPATHAEVDHLRAHHRGGVSEPANAGATCKRHNMFKSDRWYARRRRGGWVITRANGVRFSGAPATARAC